MVVAGGGAAGFFGAIAAAEKNPQASVVLLEKGVHLLSKVRIPAAAAAMSPTPVTIPGSFPSAIPGEEKPSSAL